MGTKHTTHGCINGKLVIWRGTETKVEEDETQNLAFTAQQRNEGLCNEDAKDEPTHQIKIMIFQQQAQGIPIDAGANFSAYRPPQHCTAQKFESGKQNSMDFTDLGTQKISKTISKVWPPSGSLNHWDLWPPSGSQPLSQGLLKNPHGLNRSQQPATSTPRHHKKLQREPKNSSALPDKAPQFCRVFPSDSPRMTQQWDGLFHGKSMNG